MSETKTKAAKKSAETPNTAVEVVNEDLYSVADFVQNPGVLEASVYVVKAALTAHGKKELTVAEAKKIVTEFKERKVC